MPRLTVFSVRPVYYSTGLKKNTRNNNISRQIGVPEHRHCRHRVACKQKTNDKMSYTHTHTHDAVLLKLRFICCLVGVHETGFQNGRNEHESFFFFFEILHISAAPYSRCVLLLSVSEQRCRFASNSVENSAVTTQQDAIRSYFVRRICSEIVNRVIGVGRPVFRCAANYLWTSSSLIIHTRRSDIYVLRDVTVHI